jgi:hypothetical protein
MRMEVHELSTVLQQFDQDAEVIATWEGLLRDVEVYRAADGRIIIDADGGNYRERLQKTPCSVCGKQAEGRLNSGEAVCYTHWNE